MVVSVLWPFITMPWVGLQCQNVAFPGHSQLSFTVAVDTLFIGDPVVCEGCI